MKQAQAFTRDSKLLICISTIITGLLSNKLTRNKYRTSKRITTRLLAQPRIGFFSVDACHAIFSSSGASSFWFHNSCCYLNVKPCWHSFISWTIKTILSTFAVFTLTVSWCKMYFERQIQVLFTMTFVVVTRTFKRPHYESTAVLIYCWSCDSCP